MCVCVWWLNTLFAAFFLVICCFVGFLDVRNLTVISGL